MNLDIKANLKNEIATIHINGEVDLYSSKEVRETIIKYTKSKTPAILVNLSDVKYMDSSGVATLIEGLQQSKKYDGRFILVGLLPNVREVFELTRLDKVFEIRNDIQSALEYLKA